jgi:hypothetical protein
MQTMLLFQRNLQPPFSNSSAPQEGPGSFQMFVTLHQIMWCHTSEDSNLHNNCCGNLKSHTILEFSELFIDFLSISDN